MPSVASTFVEFFWLALTTSVDAASGTPFHFDGIELDVVAAIETKVLFDVGRMKRNLSLFHVVPATGFESRSRARPRTPLPDQIACSAVAVEGLTNVYA